MKRIHRVVQMHIASDIQNRQSSRIYINWYGEPQQVSSRKAQLPRQRTQLTRIRDNTQTDYRDQLDRDINNEEIRQQLRSEQSSGRELKRGEWAGLSSRAESSRRLRTRVDKPVKDSIGQTTTPTRTRSQSRSRHRSRSRTVEVTTSWYEYAPTKESRGSRGRLRNRPSNRISETSSTRNDYKKQSSSKSSSNPKVHFPKKNLFSKLPKFNRPKDTVVDVRKLNFHQQTKSSGRSNGRFSQKEDIQPSQPFQQKESQNDYQNKELQSLQFINIVQLYNCNMLLTSLY